MSRKNWGIVLIIVGVLLAVLSALADVIRIGALPGTFGIGQIGGLIVGIVLVVVGLYLLFSQPEAPAAKPAQAEVSQPEDLTRIEGIGPKLQSILHQAGLTTFKAVAEATPDKITEIVKAAGFAAPFDASSWPEQAGLAAKGDWAALEALQEKLVGGRGD
jgi:hypothetical protein